MPQDDPATENSRTEGASAERVADDTRKAPLGEIGADSVKAGLRAQGEMLDVLHDIGQDWLARATSEAELALNLPSKLTAAPSIPEALTAYQEWLSEWMNRFSEDSRRFISSQRIVDQGVRCFTVASPGATT
jgi:hypothetical protein